MGQHSGSKHIKSACAIAKLIGAEGFNARVANLCDKYIQKRCMRSKDVRRLRRLSRDFGEIMAELSEGDRLIVGKFISMHKWMSFDAGLRTGLGAFVARNAEDVPIDPEITAENRDRGPTDDDEAQQEIKTRQASGENGNGRNRRPA